MIGLVDGNNFFVSCNRVVNPKLNCNRMESIASFTAQSATKLRRLGMLGLTATCMLGWRSRGCSRVGGAVLV